MEPVEIKVSRRGRKRRMSEVRDVGVEVGKVGEKKARLDCLVGRYVMKEFSGSGVFIGKVVYYDSGLYRVDYEDGDCEDLDSREIRSLRVDENVLKGRWRVRKKKLDDRVAKKSYLSKDESINDAAIDVEVSPLVENETGSCDDDDDGSTVENETVLGNGEEDCSRDSSDRVSSMEDEIVVHVPPPELPPSSGTISVPEYYVSHLFSVYTFLRSFSIRLFLSPFGLDDFVGSLNTTSPNALLDAVHTSLLRALSRHLEALASDGSERASKCQRGVDWRLLDLLTWPVYLVHYLTVMKHRKRPDWKGLDTDLIDVEYYSLPTTTKLMILQFLCDDVLDFAELRAEIDMREEEEVGMDSDVTTTRRLENVPRKVHPRKSKTSICKDREVLKIAEKTHELNLSVSEGDSEAEDLDMDANSDECCICGMDGTLLCCDGCPSAFHSRCISVSKVSIPEGSWFCPECIINKISPIVTVENSLRGAEMFGIDIYGRLFMASCNHLLVLNASADMEARVRYYNQNDIPNVMQALHSSAEHTAIYSGLCKSILHYWNIPETTSALPEHVERGLEAPVENIGSVCPTLSPNPSGMENHKATQSLVEGTLDISVSNVEKVAAISSNTPAIIKRIEVSCLHQSGDANHDLTNQRLSDMSFEDFARSSTSSNSSINKQGVSTVAPAKMLSRTREVCNGIGGRNVEHDCLYTGSLLKSFSYFNNYSHGEFAASAAASLAIVTSEQKVSEDRASDISRKFLAANIALQVKSFSSIANRFFWPYFERKHGEVPRERCGWCLACKSPPSNKKGCLLNSAALNAIRNSMKILGKLCPATNEIGNLPKIATYMLYMEESLRGLTVGPFLSATFRRKWHKQVKEASAVNTLKSLLLELEENIRPIALSVDWVKLVDNRPNEASAAHNASTSVGQTQKRAQGRPGRKSKKQCVDSGPIEASWAQIAPSSVAQTQKRGPGRPSQKQLPVSKVISNTSNDVFWWRGSKQSESIFQKATLPLSIVKKAARIGGKRKIAGVDYAEGSDIPRRSTQLKWRAAVKISKNVPQLALQVRYLDFHVKWSDLSRSEQIVQEGKGGAETEASAFRNALICDKKVTDKKIIYGVAFGNQKHLPSRVMKNIIIAEKDEDGKDKLWFDEMRIPLYLIKEYEEKTEQASLPSDHKSPYSLSKLQKRQLKASRKDAFAYLLRRRDNWDKCSCASCQLDVILGNAVKCSACEGYCHKSCTISSTSHSNVGRQKETANSSPTTPIPLQANIYQKVGTASTSAMLIGRSQSLASSVNKGAASDIKQATSGAGKRNKKIICGWGIIYKKKKEGLQEDEDIAVYFRLYNILQRGDPAAHLTKPCCYLCRKPYNPDLTYIHCGHCKNWYHGDALELEESRIPEVVGFKCLKCRRQKSPECPYRDKLEQTNKPKKDSSKAIDPVSITCKQCYDVNTLRQKETANSSPTTPLPLQANVYQKVGTASTSAKLKGRSQSQASSVNKGAVSYIKQATSGAGKRNKNIIRGWGIMYKKKNGELQEVEDISVYFRLYNILQRGDPAAHLTKPCCYLCRKPYNPDLTYIHCGHCKSWYHGDALELEESRIPEVVGFKCLKCRRQKSPECPYRDKLEQTNKPKKDSSKAIDPVSITCKQCHDINTIRQKETANSSPTTPIPLQANIYQKVGTASTSAMLIARSQFLASSVNKGAASDMKQATSGAGKRNKKIICSWGIIYKMKKEGLQEVEDIGVYFRLYNILQRGDPDAHLTKPCCNLCRKPYNPDLTYIHCGHCKNWYHGDALELEESRIPEVVGFKCLKCRRQKSPECPYRDTLERTNKPRKDSSKAIDPMSQIKTKKLVVRGPMNPMIPKKEESASFIRDNTITNDKPKLGSDSGNVSGIGLRKLPVRRQMKREEDTYGFVGNNHQSPLASPSPLESNGLYCHTNDAAPPVIDWDMPLNGIEDETNFDTQGFDYQDMEFEPQTYFSVYELMPSEDGGMDKNDASMGLIGNMDSLSPFTNEEFFETSELESPMNEQGGAGACKRCSRNEPVPELVCQTCSLLIHSHCSLDEDPDPSDKWKCGSCREWQ